MLSSNSMRYFLLFIKKTLRLLLKPLSFVPALLVAAMIFGFSSEDAEGSSVQSELLTRRIIVEYNERMQKGWSEYQIEVYTDRMEIYVRKAAHMAEYCLLAITLAVPLYVYGLRGFYLILFTSALCAAYACTDEYHQLFSTGRSASARDVGIDSAGALIGSYIGRFVSWLGSATLFRPLRLSPRRRRRRR
ncbi:VanZ family protein [Lachnoclostridium sp. Marseille-P6806]|uniref:VanZ family protein n=1 Tax=Lachnoclostridium sp. Marseille-P6806 TaxID=2364793 RepID=UPI001F5EDE3C|nr:VanZ family protein [Lachnoclostridium sp. Marseille-P6806]